MMLCIFGLTDCELLSYAQDRAGALSSLVVLCGDHGMSDHGGHGGSTPSETGTPLIFMSSIFQQGHGEQLVGDWRDFVSV